MVRVAGAKGGPEADLDLYLLNCTKPEKPEAPKEEQEKGNKSPMRPPAPCAPAGKAADRRLRRRARGLQPETGSVGRVVDAFQARSGGAVEYDYADFFAHPSFGSISVADLPDDRAAAAHWTAAANAWSAKLPDSPREPAARVLATSPEAMRIVGFGTADSSRLTLGEYDIWFGQARGGRRRRAVIGARRRVLFPGVAAALIAAVWVFPASAAAAAEAARIVVGPNMLASRDGDFPHVELVVAASPKNAKNLVGGAITYTRPEGGTANRSYATLDGGASWKASDFPEQVKWGSGDPYVAFTPQGTAIFSGLAFITDDAGRTRAGLYVYRSEDGGLTWGKGADLGYSYDHEQIAVDHTTGRYAGRIYIGVLYGPYPEYCRGDLSFGGRREDVDRPGRGGQRGRQDRDQRCHADGPLRRDAHRAVRGLRVPAGQGQADRQDLEHVVVRPFIRRRRHVRSAPEGPDAVA